MKFISYAQNFEDVTLWRTLKLFGPGFYIDVGANHPTHDSVSRSLYERGWRGINIEPMKQYYDELCKQRPEDVNLCIAISDKNEDLTFFECPDTGLSTVSVEMVKTQRKEGIPFLERTVKAMTLANVCDEHIKDATSIHFLKIDVEGHEEPVLRSMDFNRWRPWLLLIESPFDQNPIWQSIVLEAGYQFVFCDGINRYYIANEKQELLVPLSFPPNIMDEFQLCQGHRLSHPIEESSDLREELNKTRLRAEKAELELKSIYNSRMWNLTTTLHKIKNKAAKGKNWLRQQVSSLR